MVRVDRARRAVITTYLIFGVVSMAWVPRLPEIKANIGENAATFGALTGTGTLGAIIAMFIASRVLHNVGSRRSALIFGTLTFSAMALIPHQTNPILYGLNVAVYGACSSALSTSLNIQSLAIEEARGIPSISGLHAAWATGATLSCLGASLVVPYVPLAIHLDLLSILGLLILWSQIKNMYSHAEEGLPETEVVRSRDLLKPSRHALIIGIAFTAGSFAEWAMGDWAAIFSHEVLGSSLSGAAFTFTFIMCAITAARLVGNRVIGRLGPVRTVQTAATFIFGGLSLVFISGHLVGSAPHTVVTVISLAGFAITGLGSGAVVPNFISSIATITSVPRAVAVGQVILIQQAGISLLKAITSWSVGQFGLANAILIPGLIAGIAFAYAGVTAKPQPASQPQGQ